MAAKKRKRKPGPKPDTKLVKEALALVAGADDDHILALERDAAEELRRRIKGKRASEGAPTFFELTTALQKSSSIRTGRMFMAPKQDDSAPSTNDDLKDDDDEEAKEAKPAP